MDTLMLDEKTIRRYVRTMAGARFYGLGIGQEIVADRPSLAEVDTRWLYLDLETDASRKAKVAAEKGAIPRGYDQRSWERRVLASLRSDRETAHAHQVRNGKWSIDFDSRKASPEEVRYLTDLLDTLVADHPDPRAGHKQQYQIHLVDRLPGETVDSKALAKSFNGGWEMFIRYDALRKLDPEVYGPPDTMPSFDPADPLPFVLAHEWGHLIASADTRQRRDYRHVWASQRKHLGDYGQGSVDEGWGEAFAEWVTSNGTTGNPAVRAYAQAFGWR